MTIPDPNPPDRGPSPSQVRQSRELLVEASLTTSKNVKSKNVKWTDACFRVRSTPSEALTLSLTLTLTLTLALALALTEPQVKFPEGGGKKIYSCNEGNSPNWDLPILDYINW